MTTLNAIRNAYEAGAVCKQDFIEAIHARHALLFEYSSFFADTDVEALQVTPDGIFVRSRSQQIDLLLDPQDQHLVPYTLMNFRHYECAETAFLKAITQPDWTVLDIGANCGWYALALARHCPSARIHAFEPIPHTHRILQRNIQRNGLSNITVHQLALSNVEAMLEFFHTPACSGATSLTIAGQPTAEANLERIPARSVTLDSFCTQHGLKPQLIKCDVEGAELMVIQGAEHTIAESRPVILIELLRKWALKFGYHPNDVIAILDRLGYRAFRFTGGGLVRMPSMDDETRETNFIFLHIEQHRQLLPQ